MSQNKDLGKQISDTVRSALESGDLSRLKELGPTVQDAVKDFTSSININTNTEPAQSPPSRAPQEPRAHTAHTQPKAAPPSQPYYTQQAQAQRPVWQGQAPLPQKKMGPSVNTGLPAMVFGVLGLVTTGLLSLAFGLVALLTAGLSMLVTAALSLAGFVGSGLLLGSGVTKRKLAGRVRRYYAMLLQYKNVLTFENIAKITGMTQEAAKKDIKKAMDKKMMPDVRMDVQETCIMRGPEAYQLYVETEKARRQREEEEAEHKQRMRDPETAELEEFKAKGAATIRKIREANDAIPGEEISLKLEKLENTTANIFSYVEKHPEKLPDTRKFMDYYLPTTLKLVEKYRQYEEESVQVASIEKAKGEIEKALDTIDTAFQNLLESLYHEDTLDVTTDIEVLEDMLEQEGLTGNRFEIHADQ